MIALLSLIYGSFYFLFFKKLKLFAESVRNISIFVGFGVAMIGAVVYAWWTFAPTTFDGRVFQYVIPIVPNVQGQVIEVPIEGNVIVNKGDVLFKILPTPFQFNVDRLKAAIDQAIAQKRLAEIEVERATGLVKASAGAQSQLDQWNAQLAIAEASIASLKAQLGTAQWQLDETVVRAPYEGYVFNLQLRPGNFVTSVPAGSSMSFVSAESHTVLASFSQSAIRYVRVGDPVEMVFRSKPGKVYAGKVERIVKASGTAQLSASSRMLVMTGQPENSRWPVVVKFDDPQAAKELPQSAGASIIAVYTQKGGPLHIISKVTVRISAWTGYLTSP
ncbi:MAG: HlyD family secretion protein [Gammaproteobacteria bacterium]|nr:MAG: HlyD family secretion protein [Gammaproteobacteria bacterium]